MSQFQSQFDCIIIGTGKSGQAAVEALKEKGKNALYINLTPETITTMVSQQTLKETKLSSDPSSQTETFVIKGQDWRILLHKQTLHTATSKTATYTFQVAPVPVQESGQPQAFSTNDAEEMVDMQPELKKEEPEVLEAERVEYATPFSIFGERNLLRKKSLRRKSKLTFQEHPDPEDEYPVYHLERIELEDDEFDDYSHSTLDTHSIYAHEQKDETQEEENEYAEDEPPVYRERELKLRKRLTGNNRLQVLDVEPQETKQETNQSEKFFENYRYQEQSSMFQEQPFQPFSYQPNFIQSQYEQNDESRYESDPYDPHSFESNQMETNPYEREEKETEVFTLEPFSSRRRSRTQKKARLQSLVEKREKKQSKRPASIFWEEPASTQEQNHSLFPNGQPTIQPFSRKHAQNNKQETESSLKRDDIEFEDAYGGYNSWEEFLTPFSQNSRKRQEMDKIEKRKIALRGLHNLINNLG